jgi:hypothetical protein
MKQLKWLKPVMMVFCLIFLVTAVEAQQKFTVSGTIKSKKTGETIIGASVKLADKPGGTTSNEYGFYSLTLTEGSYTLEITAVSKKPDTVTIELNKDIRLNIFLQEEPKNQDEVTVTGRARGGRTITGTQTGIEKLTTREIKNIPVLFGEKDVLKTIQLLPGIKS